MSDQIDWKKQDAEELTTLEKEWARLQDEILEVRAEEERLQARRHDLHRRQEEVSDRMLRIRAKGSGYPGRSSPDDAA